MRNIDGVIGSGTHDDHLYAKLIVLFGIDQLNFNFIAASHHHTFKIKFRKAER